MKVSVILPNYNYSRYLGERIEGILNQSFQDFELIMLDDCSTDGSMEIMNRYKDDPHVTAIVENDKNSGSPFVQWMKGISMAQGEYVWIAEADDVAEKDFLQQCVEALDNNPVAAVCYTRSLRMDENNNPLPTKKEREAEVPYTVFDGKEFASRNMYWRCYIENASAVVFRRQAYMQCDVSRCLEMHSSGDWLFWFKMCMQGDVIRVQRPLNHFRQHTASVTKRAISEGICFFEDADILRIIEDSLPPISTYRRTMRYGQLMRLLEHSKVRDEKKQELYVHIERTLGAKKICRTLEKLNRLVRFLPGIVTMKSDALPLS